MREVDEGKEEGRREGIKVGPRCKEKKEQRNVESVERRRKTGERKLITVDEAPAGLYGPHRWGWWAKKRHSWRAKMGGGDRWTTLNGETRPMRRKGVSEYCRTCDHHADALQCYEDGDR